MRPSRKKTPVTQIGVSHCEPRAKRSFGFAQDMVCPRDPKQFICPREWGAGSGSGYLLGCGKSGVDGGDGLVAAGPEQVVGLGAGGKDLVG